MQWLLISDDNCRYEAVPSNISTLLKPPGFGDFRKKNQQFSVALPTP